MTRLSQPEPAPRRAPSDDLNREPPANGDRLSRTASLTDKSNRFIRRGFRERVIHLGDLPRGVRLLAIFGYANVAVLLGALLFFELAGDRLSDVVVFDTDTTMPHQLPFPTVIVSLLAFAVGWSLILTGASDCRRRVFLPVLGFFVFQMYLLTKVFGNAPWAPQEKAWWLTLIVAILVAGVHLFTHRLRYWRNLPLVEFATWLAVMLAVFALLLGLPKEELSERSFYLFFLMLIVSTPFWVMLGLEVVDLAVSLSRSAVRGLSQRLPEGRFRKLTVSLLVAQSLFAGFVFINGWADVVPLGEILPETLYAHFWWFCLFELFLVTPLVLAASGMRIRRRWTTGGATMLLSISLASLVISVGGSLALVGGKDFAEAGLSAVPVIPPFLLFAGLMAFDVLNFGARFANSEGTLVPRSGRVLMYFGVVSLVLSVTLIFVSERVPETAQSSGLFPMSEVVQTYINVLFASGVLLLGPLYLAWMAWRRREQLTGPHTDVTAPQPLQVSEDHVSGRSENQGLLALMAGAIFGILGFFVSFILLGIVSFPLLGGHVMLLAFQSFGMVWGTLALVAVVAGIMAALGAAIRYVKGALSASVINVLASAAVVYVLVCVLLVGLFLAYSSNQLSAGEVSGDEFEPALSFTVGDGWQNFYQQPDILQLSREQVSWLSFLGVREVYDPEKPAEGNTLPASADMVAWLKNHPNLDVTAEEEVRVGDVSGVQLDALVSPAPEDYPADCALPCIPLFQLGDETPYRVFDGYKNRIIVLRVEGETVIVVIQSPAAEFDEFLPIAEEVLSTVKWRG